MLDQDNRATAAARAIVQAKVEIPACAAHVIRRERVANLVRQLLSSRRVLVVAATAGAGKTSAVIEGLEGWSRPVAWLSVDRTDQAPGRLLVYIESALSAAVPGLDSVVSPALAAGLEHVEVAGLLAEAVVGAPPVLVLDELERLGEAAEAWAVIEALIRYFPAEGRIVLLSRRNIPADLCALPGAEQLARIGEMQLAFTVEEAARALNALGGTDIDPDEAVAVTGGWVTGVLFEVWRLDEHVAGTGGETDPLDSYLSSHILAQLRDDDRAFLIATSLLDEVTPERAEALGLSRTRERLHSLRGAHLPVSFDPSGGAMRCHSRFREYLQSRLELTEEAGLRRMRIDHARLLERERRHEEATEELLAAGALEEAVAPACRAIGEVIERLDFQIAERWLDALSDIAPPGAGPLATAELMLALAKDDYRRAARVGDQLAALDQREQLVATSTQAGWLMALAYMHTAQSEGWRSVIETLEPGPARDALLHTNRILDEVALASSPPPWTGSPLDALLYMTEYALGHIGSLVDEPDSDRWVSVLTRPWRVAGLRASGQVQRALELYEHLSGAESRQIALLAFAGPDVLVDAGRRDEAYALLDRGEAAARESGSVGYTGMNAVSAARCALRLDRDTSRARAVLSRAESFGAIDYFAMVREAALMWRGYADLLDGNAVSGLELLERAVAGMCAGHRGLDLPTAAVYLAEARWRAGDEEGADAAADLALAAAHEQGANHALLQALADFPAVLSRRLDAEPRADSPWHELGRALVAQESAPRPAAGMTVQLREFGREEILLDGAPAKPRIVKSYELLSFLVSQPSGSAERRTVLNELFDGRVDNSTRAYLRQSVHWLRQALGDRSYVQPLSAPARSLSTRPSPSPPKRRNSSGDSPRRHACKVPAGSSPSSPRWRSTTGASSCPARSPSGRVGAVSSSRRGPSQRDWTPGSSRCSSDVSPRRGGSPTMLWRSPRLGRSAGASRCE